MSRKLWIGPLAGVGIVLFLIVAFSACKYNSLVGAEENVDGAWAEVENQLKRRADLIPNLVETVKGFAAQEKEVFTTVSEARSRLLNAKGPKEAAKANSELGSALGRLLMLRESYPDLKSNKNFLALQEQLEGTENRIAVARKRYNDKVRDYNKMIKKFPNNLFAGTFGFDEKEYFEVPEEDKAAPDVNFTDG